MNIIFFLVLCLVGELALGMGSTPVFPGNPLSPTEGPYINDMEETTVGINQFSPDRGHLNQQKMEENEMKKAPQKEKRSQERADKPLPAEKIFINRE